MPQRARSRRVSNFRVTQNGRGETTDATLNQEEVMEIASAKARNYRAAAAVIPRISEAIA